MANNENLKPVRTKSKARERGRNGGIASGKSRRRTARLRDTANRLLALQAEVLDYQMNILVRMPDYSIRRPASG